MYIYIYDRGPRALAPPPVMWSVVPRSVDTRISGNHDSTRENGRQEAHEAHFFRMSQAKCKC